MNRFKFNKNIRDFKEVHRIIVSTGKGVFINEGKKSYSSVWYGHYCFVAIQGYNLISRLILACIMCELKNIRERGVPL